ncbi:MAG TPA: hypothetical protein DCG90_09905 [Sphingobium sp.]|uniref:hypothetical protein n=1 Tax=unclassified Sphingobium TaxID=2611147 RepID=UPI000ED8A00A|nr:MULTISPECIES: hypothetical protein [unclassified Sphingobium]WIW88468.1 hypothetical protein K3M67_00315 [Sphingobium sp. V4]HAF42060.1 hypothetical protein [Sphingobium sp.]
MTDGRVFLSIVAVIALGVFVNGLRFARMTSNPFVGRRLFGMPMEGSELPIGRLNLIGKIQMIFAPLFLGFACALTFGFLGPVEGIETIKLH